MEAVINSCPAFAISQEYYEHPDFTLAAEAAGTVARNILEHGLSRGELVNVNVPGVSPEEFEGFEVTRLGRRVYQDQLIERVDPRGIPYFWIGGPPPSGWPSTAPTSTRSSTAGSRSRRSTSTSPAASKPAAGEVEMDRRDRDPAVDDRVEVRAVDGQPGRRRAADPEVGDPARVDPLDQLVLVDAAAEAGHLEPLALLRRDGGDVDVDELAARQAVLEDVPGDRRGGLGRRA